MKRKEFRERINLAEQELEKGNGVCFALYMNLDAGARDDFNNIFEPRSLRGKERSGIDGFSSYWLGALIHEENLQRRKFFLRMFERVALDEKLYLNY